MKFKLIALLLLVLLSSPADAQLLLLGTGPGSSSRSAVITNGALTFGAGATQTNTNPVINVGGHAALQWDRTQAWTAIAQIKIAQKPTTAAIIFTTCNTQNFSSIPGYEFWINSSGQLHTRLINTLNTNWLGAHGSTDVTDGLTHTVAMSYDGSSTSAGINFYVDGVLETTTVEAGANNLTASIVNNAPFVIGNQAFYNFSFNGTIAHFSLSNVVRNQAWVQAYTTASGSVDASMVLGYDFAEGSGFSTADVSASGFNGQVIGATWQPSATRSSAPYRIQGALSNANGASAISSITVTLSANVTSGNAVVGVFTCSCTTNLLVTDDKSNSYTVSAPNTSLAGVKTVNFYATNITNGPHILTLSLSSSTGTFMSGIADEFANVATDAADAAVINYNVSTSGVDSLTSGTFTTTQNGDLIYSVANFYVNSIKQKSGSQLLMVQGFNQGTGGQSDIGSEFFVQLTAGAGTAATWSPSGATNGHVTAIALKHR